MTIPSHAADVLRPVLPSLADEIIVTIAREVPGYQRAMGGTFGKVVRSAIEVALGRFLDSLAEPTAISDRARETYVALGRGELHAGRSLDALLAAYRIGARIAWRRFVEAGQAGGLEPEALYALGEAIFNYIDELSAESAEGYAAEQAAEAGERRRRRRRLVRLLAMDPPPAEADALAAATAAGWELPRSLAALVVAGTSPGDGDGDADAEAERLARDLAAGAIAAAQEDGTLLALLPDPDAPGRRRQVEAVLEDRAAGLGPTVPWTRTATTVRRATAAQRLAAGAGLVVAGEHLRALLLASDASLAADMAEAHLAPLAGLPAVSGERLRATLRAWLDRPGQIQAIAAELAVHPQTVRYRVRRLRELFGDRLDDPEARFDLALALRADEGAAR